MVMLDKDLVICPMCGDELVSTMTSSFVERRNSESILCVWARCEVCNHRWKEELLHGTDGINKARPER